MKYALEAFEKLYETKGRAMFVEHYCSYDKELFGSPQRYEQLCNFLNWPPVPELIEDYALQHNMTETVEKNENILKKEKFDWVFYQIEKLSQADVGRNLLIEKVKVGFKEKFEKSVDLRRFRGIWMDWRDLHRPGPRTGSTPRRSVRSQGVMQNRDGRCGQNWLSLRHGSWTTGIWIRNGGIGSNKGSAVAAGVNGFLGKLSCFGEKFC